MSHSASVHRDFDHYRYLDESTDKQTDQSINLSSSATFNDQSTVNDQSTNRSANGISKQSNKMLGGQEKLAAWLAADQSINQPVVPTPFGDRRLMYADWAASGRSLETIEQSISQSINPLYGNTHTAASFVGLSSSCLRQESRQSLHDWCRLTDDDCVLFAGNGTTDAFQLLMGIFDNHIQSINQSAGPNKQSALFIVGPYHHHSILLPLRERHQSIKVVMIDQSLSGGPDLNMLNAALKDPINQSFPLKVCVMSSASNLTGHVTDQSINRAIKQAGFYSVWDHASAASFIQPQMNIRTTDLTTNQTYFDQKDAIVMSGHKLIGGIGTPGVLFVKKKLLSNPVPVRPGGGAVFFVNGSSHRYLQNFVEREEAGTPNIVGSIKLGLIVQLMDQFDGAWKIQRTIDMTNRMYSGLRGHDNILIADDHSSCHQSSTNQSITRVPIISFLIRPNAAWNKRGRFLHPNLVSVLLNDLFGIQSRSGCMCVGPYAHDCLGINPTASKQIEQRLIDRYEILRPGFTRISLSICHSDEDIETINQSIKFIADHGHRFLSVYTYHSDTGEWRHRSRINKFVGRVWLRDLISDIKNDAINNQSTTKPHNQSATRALPDFAEMLSQAYTAASEADTMFDLNSESPLDDSAESMRWFCLESDLVNRSASQSTEPLVIRPGTWPNITDDQSTNHTTDSPDNAVECLPCMMPRRNKAAGNSTPIVTASSISPSTINQPDDVSATQSLNDELPTGGNDDDMSTTPSTHRSERLTSTRCSVCYHFHLTSTANGRCTACDCVHFTPSSDQLNGVAITQPINQSKELASLSKKLHSLVGSAIRTYNMIVAGDRVLVGVSGGKDSLTLIHLLLSMQRKSPVKFKIGAVTVDPQAPEYDPSSLKSYFASLGVPYFYESQDIINQAKTCMTGKKSICAYCARMKRGILYGTCRREGYNVLALGQHGDDLVESCLMSMMHNGKLRTMKANYTIGERDLRVIRPLVHVREKMTRAYARLTNLPVIPESCPACFEAPKERARIKRLVANQEALHPNCVSHMLRAIEPLIAIKKTGVEGNIYQADSDDEANV